MSENKQKEEKPKDKLLIAHTSNFNLLFTSEEVNGKTLSIFRPKVPKKYFLLGDYFTVRVKLLLTFSKQIRTTLELLSLLQKILLKMHI